HLLRRQVRPSKERPLVVITPKSLLRLPAAASALADFTSGGFQPLLDDLEMKSSEAINRVVLCSGKVYYDLIEARKKSPNFDRERVAIVRMEQFYPFPRKRLREVLAKYPAARELVWA